MTDQEITMIWPDLQPWLEASDEQIQDVMRQLADAYAQSSAEFAEGLRRLGSALSESE